MDENEKLTPSEVGLLLKPVVQAVLKRCGGNEELATKMLNQAARQLGVELRFMGFGKAPKE